MKKLLLFALCALALTARAFSQDEWHNPRTFGTVVKPTGITPLIGNFYDFKQTMKHEPTGMNRHSFEALVAQFLDSDWDPGLLSKYYCVSRAMYTTELMIPMMNADYAPRAYGVDKWAKPMMWMSWYKAQVIAPEPGTYRFLGSADDFVAVAVNGKTVLVADIPGTRLQVKWFAKESAPGGYTPGDWFDAKAGQVIDVDIMSGDSPGGDYRCLVQIEKKGGATGPFQVAPSAKSVPGVPPWKAVP